MGAIAGGLLAAPFAAEAAKSASGTIPIVIARVVDPVCSGLVASRAHPDGNVTAWRSSRGRWRLQARSLGGNSKFSGSERFVAGRLRELADVSAEALGPDVYGDDAIVGPEGHVVIDVNDWPSFSAVRDVASEKIPSRRVKRARAQVGG
jgi:hypothetical protein